MSETFYDLAKIVFPDATDEFLNFVLWEKTGFPQFWNIPQDGKTPRECCLKQLLSFKRELKDYPKCPAT